MLQLWAGVLALFLLLSMGFGSIQAQDDLPPILNPTRFLANGVEFIAAQPIFNYDNDTRHITYFDGSAWRDYPYPDGLREIVPFPRIEPRADGTYVLSEPSGYLLSQLPPSDIWIFDPAEGTFAHPNAACGQMQQLPGEGNWILYRASDDTPFQLCSTETGEIKPPFPKDLQAYPCDNRQSPPVTSPDGRWVVFSDCHFDPEPVMLYAYDLQNELVVALGAGASKDNRTVEIAYWIDDTHPVIHIYTMGDQAYRSFFSVYTADMTRENSLTLVVSLRYVLPKVSLDGKSLEWFPSNQFGIEGDVSDPDWCKLHHYDLETNTLTLSPEIPGVCGGIPIPDGSGDYLYRSITFPDKGLPQTARLARYNLQTGEIHDLYSGEIEWLQNVSPDGHYALLILDNNGQIDCLCNWERAQFGWGKLPAVWTAIFDLQTQTIVFELAYVANSPYEGYPIVDWLENNRMMVSLNTGGVNYPRAFPQVVSLQQPIRTKLLIGLPFAIDESQFFLRSDYGDFTSIDQYDVEIGATTHIAHIPDNTQYDIQLARNNDNTLMISISDAERRDFILAKWVVRLPLTD